MTSEERSRELLRPGALVPRLPGVDRRLAIAKKARVCQGFFLGSDLGFTKWGNFALVVFLGSDLGFAKWGNFVLVGSLWR